MQVYLLRFLSFLNQYSVDVVPLEINISCWIITNTSNSAISSAYIAAMKHKAILKMDVSYWQVTDLRHFQYSLNVIKDFATVIGK